MSVRYGDFGPRYAHAHDTLSTQHICTGALNVNYMYAHHRIFNFIARICPNYAILTVLHQFAQNGYPHRELIRLVMMIWNIKR